MKTVSKNRQARFSIPLRKIQTVINTLKKTMWFGHLSKTEQFDLAKDLAWRLSSREVENRIVVLDLAKKVTDWSV